MNIGFPFVDRLFVCLLVDGVQFLFGSYLLAVVRVSPAFGVPIRATVLTER